MNAHCRARYDDIFELPLRLLDDANNFTAPGAQNGVHVEDACGSSIQEDSVVVHLESMSDNDRGNGMDSVPETLLPEQLARRYVYKYDESGKNNFTVWRDALPVFI